MGSFGCLQVVTLRPHDGTVFGSDKYAKRIVNCRFDDNWGGADGRPAESLMSASVGIVPAREITACIISSSTRIDKLFSSTPTADSDNRPTRGKKSENKSAREREGKLNEGWCEHESNHFHVNFNARHNISCPIHKSGGKLSSSRCIQEMSWVRVDELGERKWAAKRFFSEQFSHRLPNVYDCIAR